MAWNNVNESAAAINTSSVLENQMGSRGNRDSGLSNAMDMFGGFTAGKGEYSMVGIKASQVEPMRNAIRTYVKTVQDTLDEALNAADKGKNIAFRGSALEESVSTYLVQVKDYCMNLISTLLAFSDKLADVSNAWLKATQSMAGNVTDATSAFSAGTAYNDTHEAISR